MKGKNRMLLIALLATGLFFCVPLYYNWLFHFILQPNISYSVELKHMDIADRKEMRYGGAYATYMDWVKSLKERNVHDPIILFPPIGFFRSPVTFPVQPVEPAMFYYFTGLKAAIATSPYVHDANWAMVPSPSGTALRKIKNKEDLDGLIKIYSGF